MRSPIHLPFLRDPDAAGCSPLHPAIVACVAASLLIVTGSHTVAEPAQREGTSAAIASERPAAEADAVPDRLPPFAFAAPVLKPPAPADLPPPNVFAALSVLGRTSANFPRDWRASRAEFRAIIQREATAYGLPPALLDAVMAVESGYNPAVVGMDGEIGLMQVMPATARMLGFTGTHAQLADPQVNIHYGAEYLAGAWRLAGEDVCTATMKYRAGHGETRFSFLSVDYCVRVRNHLAAQGVAVKGEVPRPTFGMQGGLRTRDRSLSGSAARSVNFAALNAQMRALTDRMTPRAVH